MSRSIFMLLLLGIPLSALCQPKNNLPIYPNAKLNTTLEQGEEAVCCSFSTPDPLDKVVKFYETLLKSKALDAAALGAKYPAMKAQLQQAQAQMPPGFQYRAFVLGETHYSGAPQPVLFEVYAGKGRTGFILSEEDLGLAGAQYAYEFRKATGTLSEGDKAFAEWQTMHPPVKQTQFDFPVYPGSLVGSVDNDGLGADPMNPGVRASKCSAVTLYFLDTLAFDKVIAFYKSNLKGLFKMTSDGKLPDRLFAMEDRQFFWQESGVGGEGGGKREFHGKQGDVNRFLEIGFDRIVPSFPYFDAEQKTRVAGTPGACIVVSFKSEILDGTCVELPNTKK